MAKTEELEKLFPRYTMTMGEIRKKYPHVVPGTLRGHGNERTVKIKCTKRGCVNTRRTRTMDLFQVKLCEEHQLERDKELTAGRRRRWRERDKQRREDVREGRD